MISDERYLNIKSRLRLLTKEQLLRIMNADTNEVCYDTYNYDAANQTYCPLAIAFNVPQLLNESGFEPSQELVLSVLQELAGKAWGTVKGVPGEFYTNNRAHDLKSLCEEVLREHESNES